LTPEQRQTLSAQTKAVREVMVERGEFTGGLPPYGQRIAADGKHLEPDAGEQGVIAAARELRAEGHSLRGIAEELEARGHRSPTGLPFHPTQIRRLVDDTKPAPAVDTGGLRRNEPRESVAEQIASEARRIKPPGLGPLGRGKGNGRGRPPMPDDILRPAVQLVADGASVIEAAQKTGVSRNTVTTAVLGKPAGEGRRPNITPEHARLWLVLHPAQATEPVAALSPEDAIDEWVTRGKAIYDRLSAEYDGLCQEHDSIEERQVKLSTQLSRMEAMFAGLRSEDAK
jgi:DNA invertase Pin-like site-specific DNA recombinase